MCSAPAADGFSAAFSTAVDAFCRGDRSAGATAHDTVVDFAVRMGLHTGEAINATATTSATR